MMIALRPTTMYFSQKSIDMVLETIDEFGQVGGIKAVRLLGGPNLMFGLATSKIATDYIIANREMFEITADFSFRVPITKTVLYDPMTGKLSIRKPLPEDLL